MCGRNDFCLLDIRIKTSADYEAIATTTDEKICITINNTIPHRNDKEKIVCVHLLGNEFTQVHEFDYDFTHDFDASLLVI